jgi:putative transposase
MPRLARLDAPGVLNHVIVRGIERRHIFRDDKDRDNLVERLSKLLPETQTTCYAWALLPNHAHFLLRSGDVGLPPLMRRLLTGYAVSFNRRHRRHGPLFQNRYKSIICQEDVYLKELVRYIHLNPLRAGVIVDLKTLGEYPYCGHSVLMGKNERSWQDTRYVLSYFGGRIKEARDHYLSYVLAGIDQGRRPELVGGGLIRSLGGWEEVKKIPVKGQSRVKGDERILGESEFVTEVLFSANEQYDRQYELKRLGYDIQKVADVVAKIYEMDKSSLFSKGRQKIKVEARSLLCYWAARELGMSLTHISRHLGMSPPGVGYAVERGEIIARKNNYQMIDGLS